MTRTPDEIKKGLEEEIPVHYHIDGEPRLTPRLLMDMQWLHKDALALIRQLEDHLREATKKVKQLEAERDAAVADLAYVKDCDTCKYDNACLTGKKDCFGCHAKSCPCLICQYEWRGVQKEESPC